MNTIEWKKFRAAITLFVVLASVLLCVVILYTLKSISFVGSAPITNTILVNGHGESFAKPDIATVSFSVSKTAKTVADAQDQVTAISNDVLATLKAQGIADKDIQTTSYDVSPNYDYQAALCTVNNCPPSKQILSGYTVTQSQSLTIRALDKAGDILGVLGQKNVSNVSGLTFSVENDSAIKADARNKAITEAKQQAETLAKQLGVRLVRITSFSDSTAGRPIYYAKDMLMSSGVAAPSVPTVQVGQNKTTSDVTITYEIQ